MLLSPRPYLKATDVSLQSSGQSRSQLVNLESSSFYRLTSSTLKRWTRLCGPPPFGCRYAEEPRPGTLFYCDVPNHMGTLEQNFPCSSWADWFECRWDRYKCFVPPIRWHRLSLGRPWCVLQRQVFLNNLVFAVQVHIGLSLIHLSRKAANL